MSLTKCRSLCSPSAAATPSSTSLKGEPSVSKKSSSEFISRAAAGGPASLRRDAIESSGVSGRRGTSPPSGADAPWCRSSLHLEITLCTPCAVPSFVDGVVAGLRPFLRGDFTAAGRMRACRAGLFLEASMPEIGSVAFHGWRVVCARTLVMSALVPL
ncbi:unnamed protein product [Chondrus crispus]|uniref:Uncharacterized protein n=1 Tax=Chondrus crispus TaxID=2769 RepID=R7QTB7_CHOCR|nr:unnamed protein product [Chondrus crispus]CDF40953.1 unnamed protein product [Chondrus crispus]|eukprot:XP_005711247.1 unnamed protein product [Chondrus crispus]